MASRTLAKAVQELPHRSRLAWRTIEVSEAGKAGQAEKALDMFEAMPVKNQVAWNAALAALVDAGRTDWAFSFFREMPRRNATSYTTMIGGLSHAGAAARARGLFDELPLDQHNVFTWTAMVSCHVRNGEPDRALELFVALYGELFARKMLPNAHTFSSLLKACVGIQSLTMALQLHAVIFKLLDEENRDCFVWNALIDAHAKLGSLSDAEKVFYEMQYRDICSWNIMMDGYSRHNLINRAFDLFRMMRKRDVFSWNIIIHRLSENRRGEDALHLFIDLVRLDSHCDGNGKLNASIYTTALHICSVLALLELGRQVHARTVKDGLCQSNVFVCNSLISMYSSCGATFDLEQAFDEMTVRDVISWNTVIQGLGQNGLGRQALAVAERALEQKMYNGNTFIVILTSCSHAGLVTEGLGYFDAMTEKHCVERTLDHYISAIDLLGRAGRLEKAYDLLRSMPFTPNAVAWSTLLHSCLAHKNSVLGSIVAQELKAAHPDGGGNYKRLVQGCRGGGESSEPPYGNEKSVNHTPGCSWVTLSF
ncbi:pentatricopeptide repeat-containing protein At4g16835, mitochondrial-like [Phragmites australis]|uniref:pentatricopeptide repeat-containing protein At4g16835, mitochondrial-like n=1 Tax=Phragmites australis TaxID=29695 RepID=UPI002D78E304|nr:pentatricopeptide repeat-containing protein At4g16835, mitochondrial-like [Phragmites australis]